MFRCIALILIISSPAIAQQICGPREQFLAGFRSSHQETTAHVALIHDGAVLEVLTSGKGTWTLLIVQPDGRACIFATGEAWENVPRINLDPKT